MNVTQSLSMLYSQLSSNSSSALHSSNLPTTQANLDNSLAFASQTNQERNVTLANKLSLEQKMLLQLNMYNYQYPSQIGQQSSYYKSDSMENIINEANQSVRRPITGCKNFTIKSKFNPSISSSSSSSTASSQSANPKQASFPFKHVTSVEISADHSFSSSFLPAYLSPILKYSRKVFVGGLPPDIDESKIFSFS